jgi:hypothetical protein
MAKGYTTRDEVMRVVPPPADEDDPSALGRLASKKIVSMPSAGITAVDMASE